MTKEEFAKYLVKLCSGAKDKVRKIVLGVIGSTHHKKQSLEEEIESEQDFIDLIINDFLTTEPIDNTKVILNKIAQQFSNPLLLNFSNAISDSFDESLQRFPTTKQELLERLLLLFGDNIDYFSSFLRVNQLESFTRILIQQSYPEHILTDFVNKLIGTSIKDRCRLFRALYQKDKSDIMKKWKDYHEFLLSTTKPNVSSLQGSPKYIDYMKKILECLGKEKIQKRNFEKCITQSRKIQACKLQSPSFGLICEIYGTNAYHRDMLKVLPPFMQLCNHIKKFSDIARLPEEIKAGQVQENFRKVVSKFDELLRDGIEYESLDSLEEKCTMFSNDLAEAIITHPEEKTLESYFIDNAKFVSEKRFNPHAELCTDLFAKKAGIHLVSDQVFYVFQDLLICKVINMTSHVDFGSRFIMSGVVNILETRAISIYTQILHKLKVKRNTAYNELDACFKQYGVSVAL